MIKIVALASALVVSVTTAGFAQTSSTTGPTVANPPSQGKAAPSADTAKSGSTGTSGNAMSNTKQTPGGETGPSGQQSKPK